MDFEKQCQAKYIICITAISYQRSLDFFLERFCHNQSSWQSVMPTFAFLWRHNGRNDVSNHQPHDCLLNRLFGRRSKKTSKLRVTGLCTWNWWPVNSPHKWPVTRKMFPFDDVTMGNIPWGTRVFNTLRSGQMAWILQVTHSNAFPWMEMVVFRMKHSGDVTISSASQIIGNFRVWLTVCFA